jgi:homoserine dehydrogenase
VGAGVANVLLTKRAALERRIGRPVVICTALVRDPAKPRPVSLSVPLVTDPRQVLDHPDVDVIVEVLGGEEPARTLILEAIERGKHVVTANKEVMAKHGPAIRAAAAARGVTVAYEASVGGGIPLIGPFQLDLAANDISSVVGIVNGTTNYILTRMTESGASFADALREAQELGYAEPDPTNDVEGWDAAYKLAILASLAFGAPIMPEQVFREGITQVRSATSCTRPRWAIGSSCWRSRGWSTARETRAPRARSQGSMLASVDGSFNAVRSRATDQDGLFYGRGGGSQPTASAVGRRPDRAGHERPGAGRRLPCDAAAAAADAAAANALLPAPADHRPPGRHGRHRHRARRPRHQPGQRGQKEAWSWAMTCRAPRIVLTTHTASEQAIQDALGTLRQMPAIKTVGSLLRVHD